MNTNSNPPDPDNQNLYGDVNKYLMNPSVLIIVIIVFIIYLIVFLSLGKSTSSMNGDMTSIGSTSSTSSTSSISSMIMMIFAGIVIFVIFTTFGQIAWGTDINASIQKMFGREPEIDIVVDQSKMVSAVDSELGINKNTFIKDKLVNEVFNIPGNYYGYDDAKTLCDAYGARLANYDEVESAYNQGGEWCNYGWSAGQNAFYPTQKSTFNDLQKIKGHEHDCGRPGVNGGYIANPRVKFGVNCFGKKPKMTQEEEELMHTSTPYPKNENDIKMDEEVDYWKSHLDKILVSPFNYNTWSK